MARLGVDDDGASASPSHAELPTVEELRVQLTTPASAEKFFEHLQDAEEVTEGNPTAARDLLFTTPAVRGTLFKVFAEKSTHVAVRELIAHLVLRGVSALPPGDEHAPKRRDVLDLGLVSFLSLTNLKVIVPACRAVALCVDGDVELAQIATDEGAFDRVCSLMAVQTVQEHMQAMTSACIACSKLLALQDNCRAFVARKAFPSFLQFVTRHRDAVIGSSEFSCAVATILYYLSFGGKGVNATLAAPEVLGVLVALAIQLDPYGSDDLAERATLVSLRAICNISLPSDSDKGLRDAVATQADFAALLDRVVLVPGQPGSDEIAAAALAIADNVCPTEVPGGPSATEELIGSTTLVHLCRRVAATLSDSGNLLQVELTYIEMAVRLLRRIARNQDAAREVLAALRVSGLAGLVKHFPMRFHNRSLALYVHSLVHLCHMVAEPSVQAELSEVPAGSAPVYRPTTLLLEHRLVSAGEARVINYEDDVLSDEEMKQTAALRVQRLWRGHQARVQTDSLVASKEVAVQVRHELENEHLDSRESVLQLEFDNRNDLASLFQTATQQLVQVHGQVIAARSRAEAEVDERHVLEREALVLSHERQRVGLVADHRGRLRRLQEQQRDEIAEMDEERVDVEMLDDVAERARRTDELDQRTQVIRASHAKARVALRDLMNRERDSRAIEWDEELDECDRRAQRVHPFMVLQVSEERARGLGMENRRWWVRRGIMEEERQEWARLRVGMELHWLPFGEEHSDRIIRGDEGTCWVGIGDRFLAGVGHLERAAMCLAEGIRRAEAGAEEVRLRVEAARDCSAAPLFEAELLQRHGVQRTELQQEETAARRPVAVDEAAAIEETLYGFAAGRSQIVFQKRLAGFFGPEKGGRGDVERNEGREWQRLAALHSSNSLTIQAALLTRVERAERTAVTADERTEWRDVFRMMGSGRAALALKERTVLLERSEGFQREREQASIERELSRLRRQAQTLHDMSARGASTSFEEFGRLSIREEEDECWSELAFLEVTEHCVLAEDAVRRGMDAEAVGVAVGMWRRARVAGGRIERAQLEEGEVEPRQRVDEAEREGRDGVTEQEPYGRKVAEYAVKLRLTRGEEGRLRQAVLDEQSGAVRELWETSTAAGFDLRRRLLQEAEEAARAAVRAPAGPVAIVHESESLRLSTTAAEQAGWLSLLSSSSSGWADACRRTMIRLSGSLQRTESTHRSVISERGYVALALLVQRASLEQQRVMAEGEKNLLLREQHAARVAVEAEAAASWPEIVLSQREERAAVLVEVSARDWGADFAKQCRGTLSELHRVHLRSTNTLSDNARGEVELLESAIWSALMRRASASRTRNEKASVESAEERFRYALAVEELARLSAMAVHMAGGQSDVLRFLSARIIQCAWRQRSARGHVRRRMSSRRRLMSEVRECSVAEAENEAAEKIQGLCKMRAARKEVGRRRAERCKRIDQAAAVAAILAAVPCCTRPHAALVVQRFARARLATQSRLRVKAGVALARAVHRSRAQQIGARALVAWWRRREERERERAARLSLLRRQHDHLDRERRRQAAVAVIQASALSRLSVVLSTYLLCTAVRRHAAVVQHWARFAQSRAVLRRKADEVRRNQLAAAVQAFVRARRSRAVLLCKRRVAAASALQRAFRTSRARRVVQQAMCVRWERQYRRRVHHSAVIIQSLVRGRRGRRRFARLRLDAAKVRFHKWQVQCAQAVLYLQRVARGVICGRCQAGVARRLAVRSAETVQRWWRLSLAKLVMARARVRHQQALADAWRPVAATLLQSQWRCHCARKKVGLYRAAARRFAERGVQSVLLLGRIGRGMRERVEMGIVERPAKHSAARAVQQSYRRFAAQREAERRRKARDQRDLQRYMNRQAAAVQHAYRRHAKKRTNAAIRIQRHILKILPTLATRCAVLRERRRLRLLDFRALARHETQRRQAVASEEADQHRRLLVQRPPARHRPAQEEPEVTPERAPTELSAVLQHLSDQEPRKRRRIVREAVNGLAEVGSAERESRRRARRATFIAAQQQKTRMLITAEIGGRKAVATAQQQQRRELRQRLAKVVRIARQQQAAREPSKAHQLQPDTEPLPPPAPPGAAPPSAPLTPAELPAAPPPEQAPPRAQTPLQPEHPLPPVTPQPARGDAPPPLQRADSCPPPATKSRNVVGDVTALRKMGTLNASQSLLCLDASRQQLGDVRGQPLIGSLRHATRLLALRLDGNALGDASVAALADVLRSNRSLTSVSLADNPSITDAGATELIQALKVNPVLRFLDMDGTSVSDGRKQMLGFLLSANGQPMGAARAAEASGGDPDTGPDMPPAAASWHRYQQQPDIPPIAPHNLGDVKRPAPWDRVQ
eukprot:TRINITY_DN6547_c1_g1_i2.p1 TRINITY_DN6547_c1_g1~~TRINITY_DN6547_c1_g1_i2.p1  ORF type:complete len:2353 (+),score=819.63 TRINITY_DN6547_c1_g1_i2:20-7078(+)